MTISKQSIIDELQNTSGDEFNYHGEHCSINAIKEGPNHVEIGHFVVAKKKRRNGYGTILFESLLDVLRKNDIYSATINIQAMDDGSKNDPIMKFLRKYNFEYVESYNHYNWGLCIKARGNI